MPWKFPETTRNLHCDPIHPSDDGYHCKDHGRAALCARTRHQTSTAGQIEYVNTWVQVVMAQRGKETFAKKLLGESEIEAVLQKLDRLTQEEARMMAAQTLEVVHCLVNNVKVVMDGT